MNNDAINSQTSPDDEFDVTLEEAETFLREILCMTSPMERLKSSRAAFLEDFTKAMIHHVPFQSITTNATPFTERHVPTMAEIKRDVFSKLGGLCYVLNAFCWSLLKTLSFNVTFVSADFQERVPNAHVALIVHDLTSKGSKHLVDISKSFPFFRPISLDLEGPMSPEYQDSYLRYRLVRDGTTVLVQHHIKCHPQMEEDNLSDFIKAITTPDGWATFFRFHTEKSVDMDFFQTSMTLVYTQPCSPLLITPRCLAFPNGRFTCILGTTLLVEDEVGKVKKSYMRSLDEIVEAYSRHFPQFSEAVVRKAMQDEHIIKLDFKKGL